MKPAAITFLVIFLLLTLVTASDVVLDHAGEPIMLNTPYFIKLAGESNLWVSRQRRFINKYQCPYVAVVSAKPVYFLFDSRGDYVPLSTGISIRFDISDDAQCNESGIWRVDKDSPLSVPDITSAGLPFALDFMIQKESDHLYKLFYQGLDPGNIGVYRDETTHIDHLVLDEVSLDVIFVPASDVEETRLPSFLKLYEIIKVK